MTLRFLDGFDAGDFALKWVYAAGGINIASDASNTPWGSGSCLLRDAQSGSGFSSDLKHSVGASATTIYGLKFWFADLTHGAVVILTANLGDVGATTHTGLCLDGSTGVLSVFRGSVSTILASSATALVPGRWYSIEAQFTVADSGGIANVNVDGHSVITFTGDTKNGGTASTIDTIQLWGSVGTNPQMRIDDLYVFDGLGSTNNSFVGITRVQTLMPTGAGSSTQWTPVSGANYTNVNDVPDNTATYVSDRVVGQRDTYAMADLIAGTDSIFGVQQVAHAQQLDAGTAAIKQAQKSGATVSYGPSRTLGASNAAYLDLFENNPATGLPYTQAELNAIEAGFEVA